MAFPALRPTARTWVGGQPGQGSFTAASGIGSRMMYSMSLRTNSDAELFKYLED